MSSNRKFRFTIRTKLLLLSLVILSVPYIGFEYLRELERYLRDSFETALIDSARSTAAPLHERPLLFQLHTDDEEQSIYVHELNHPIQIDGYDKDWSSYVDWSNSYSVDDNKQSDDLSFRLITSRHEQYLYALLQVSDEKISYQQQDSRGELINDYVMLVFTRPDGELEHYYFSPAAPGTLRPFRFAIYQDEFKFEYRKIDYVTNVTGEWQETANGYNLELAIPLELIGERLGFVVSSVSAEGSTVAQQLGTAGETTMLKPGKLLRSSTEISQIIKTIGANTGRRVWVLDNLGRVKASYGDLARDLSKSTVNIFYSLVLPSVHERFRDDLAGASRLRGREVEAALSGQVETRWRSSPDGKAIIVSSAAPVWAGGEVRGAVVIEEATTSMQMLRRQATASLFNKTLVIFFIVTLVLFLFASRLSYRIRQLSREAENAIDEHGRVVGSFTSSNMNDEIGELSKNYASMLERLKEYNHYLENMSGRLSHELRTPIAVVQSSLEQLQANHVDESSEQYLQRAREGIERLSLLVNRLSEATRLEQALQSAEKQSLDVKDLLRNCVEGYKAVYSDDGFGLTLLEEQLETNIAPDLFVQMLDKLIANAVDFSGADQTIDINLKKAETSWQIEIINYGSGLPEAMTGQLFNSMISIRDNKDKNKKEPHLGLGLYIARLVAEYHEGVISAENLSEQEGVKVILNFPM